MLFSAKERVLFIGDSITDAGRDREDPTSMGSGYAYFCANFIDARFAQLELTYLNRGIGGDNVVGLVNRWEEDCLDLDCQWVSLMIGK